MPDLTLPPTRDPHRTRHAILRAAQVAFSSRGYHEVGVREITAQAGVSVALVNRYFGSKEKLFEEALSIMLDTPEILNIPRDKFGESFLEILLGSGNTGKAPLTMIMMASSDAGARAITRRLLVNLVFQPLADWFGPKEGSVRAARVMMMSAGFALYHDIYPLDVVTPVLDSTLREWFIQEFQSLVDTKPS